MKLLKKIVKWFFLSIGIIAVVLFLIIFGFMKLSPQFGGKVSKAQQEEFELLSNYEEGKFVNHEPFTIDTDFKSVAEMIKNAFTNTPHSSPEKIIDVQKFDLSKIQKNESARVTWLGHSSFLIEMDGKTLLIDPIFSEFAAPHKILGKKRYNNEMSFDIDSLKQIDAVLISHDHYDHLDYPTIKKIKDRVEQVYVPLGVGNHFLRWGFDSTKIQELDWWDETTLGNIQLAFTPSRHSSGRGITDQSATLWGSWCLIGTQEKIFFSGDGGYGKHFAEIGQKYGPFDFGMIECGQYDKHWAGMHMTPEESVQAGIDVTAETFMPIHWGAFTLANHSWTDPIERFMAQAKKLNTNISTPFIGESILIKNDIKPKSDWWIEYN